ncbi:hypothetical protein Tco_0685295, partial [Tanacetum coccineum]
TSAVVAAPVGTTTALSVTFASASIVLAFLLVALS